MPSRAKGKVENEEDGDLEDYGQISQQMQAALQTTASLWTRGKSPWLLEDLPVTNRGNSSIGSLGKASVRLATARRKKTREDPNEWQARAYVHLQEQSTQA